MRINMADVQVNNFEPLPNGWWHVRVTDGEIRQSGETAKFPGEDYWNVEMTVQSGEYTDRKMWTNVSLLPHALFTLKGILQASGKYTEAQLNGDLDIDLPDLIGLEFDARTKQRTYNDDLVMDVKGFRAHQEGTGVGVQQSSGGSLLP